MDIINGVPNPQLPALPVDVLLLDGGCLTGAASGIEQKTLSKPNIPFNASY